MSACTSRRDQAGNIGFEVLAGGGLGRAPAIGQVVRDFLPLPELLAYLEAISAASTTATAGATISTRRASRYWCSPSGSSSFKRRGRERMADGARHGGSRLHAAEVDRVRSYFKPPAVSQSLPDVDATADRELRFSRLVPLQHPAAQNTRLSRRLRVPEGARPCRPAT
jgi:sulfite reductase (NADPH) hemoprotein beta-component